MILGFLFFIQTFLKHCIALSTETYKRYINILLFYILLLPLCAFTVLLPSFFALVAAYKLSCMTVQV